MTNNKEWHNTGGNGRSNACWTRTVGPVTVAIHVMTFRCLVDVYRNRSIVVEGNPFDTLEEAKAAGDLCIASEASL